MGMGMGGGGMKGGREGVCAAWGARREGTGEGVDRSGGGSE